MPELFEFDSDKEVEDYCKTCGSVSGCVTCFLIPVAILFCFLLRPLGVGLLFVGLFTLSWSLPLGCFADKELIRRSRLKK
jgi:nitrogen fixation-related uncharacterized protein